MQKFDFDKLEKNSCGNHNFLWLFAVVAVFLTDVKTPVLSFLLSYKAIIVYERIK